MGRVACFTCTLERCGLFISYFLPLIDTCEARRSGVDREGVSACAKQSSTRDTFHSSPSSARSLTHQFSRAFSTRIHMLCVSSVSLMGQSSLFALVSPPGGSEVPHSNLRRSPEPPRQIGKYLEAKCCSIKLHLKNQKIS
ncbi:hypothetical protein XU18_3585 [Perkinsela sp. CCAP 1560/4]|nr:hypothetical protein XU18_3585 [Perkinsela sp. CCAP 1560/4]|eukprot:KNH05414.1 hypothetical protein XU18_3585 [Perkinsela sp. CCAP 1560/4]